MRFGQLTRCSSQRLSQRPKETRVRFHLFASMNDYGLPQE
jgi:hypothetical protein